METGTVAERCLKARLALGLTQDELARRAGVTRDVIAMIELGRTKRPRKIEQIAKALEVSPAWLAFGKPDLDRLSAEAIEAALVLDGLPTEVRSALIAAIKASKR